jgi:hypothetical protein
MELQARSIKQEIYMRLRAVSSSKKFVEVTLDHTSIVSKSTFACMKCRAAVNKSKKVEKLTMAKRVKGKK